MRVINLYNLQFKDLELFLTVAKHASFTKAGEKMFVTQSWVSKRINQMENELGLTLFIRNKREVVLTPAGRVLERRLTNITDTLLSAIQEAHTAQTGASGLLRIGFLDWESIVFFDQLERFKNENPQLPIEIYRRNFFDLRSDIALNQLDLIFTVSYDCNQFSSDEYHFLHLKKVPLLAYMSKNHPLAKKKILDIEDLRAEPLLMVDQESSSGYYDFIRQLFLNRNIRPLIAQYAHNGGEHIGSILFNKGILLASQCFLENSWEKQIARVPIKDVTVNITAIWKKRNTNPALMKFLQTIVNENE